MQSFFKKLAFSIAMTVCAVLPVETEAMPEILPLNEIQSGMSGTAYTVVDNSGVIEPFNVDIIGLMDNGKGSSKMIMAKASGSVIDKTGGILQGMSGSPIYVDGKLVGAVAIGLKEMSPYTFFITPIENMLPLWSMPDPKAVNKYHQIPIKHPDSDKKSSDDSSEVEDKSVENKSIDDQSSDENESDDTINGNDPLAPSTEEIELPPIEINDNTDDENLPSESEELIIHNDLNAVEFLETGDLRVINLLDSELESMGLRYLYAAPTTSEGKKIDYDASLEPGAPIGVAVVYGDFSVGATGTVTAVDGKKVLGFGHSFTHAGNVNYFMTDASVIGSIKGTEGAGVKISSLGNIIGRINQDREAGIAGIIGNFPSVVPISITISDKTLNRTETYNATIAYNETLIPKLGASIAYSALSKVADSLAESTVVVDFGIKTNAVASGKIERQNMFYNGSDVGQVAVIELMQALNLVCSNTAAESDIFSIDVNMTLNNERRTASLVSAIPDKAKVKPGETVNLTVQLQPYRQKSETIVVPYTVPITMKSGPLTLDVHGGALVPLAQILANAGFIINTNEPVKTSEEKINNFINAGKNNQLVVEPGGVAEPQTERELKKEIERARRAQAKAAKLGQKPEGSPAESKVDTGYIIDNVIHTVIDVDKI